MFQNLFLGSVILLRQDNMMEHDRKFIFVYVKSGKWVDAGSRGVGTIDVQNKRLFMRSGRMVEGYENRQVEQKADITIDGQTNRRVEQKKGRTKER